MTTRIVADWYLVQEIGPNIFWIKEPSIVSFYIFKSGKKALFIDSGLALSDTDTETLLKELDIDEYQVVCTHAHCDHTGLNFGAKECGISKTEWEKYNFQNESTQRGNFLQVLKQTNKIPTSFDILNTKKAEVWSPTYFLEDGQTFSFSQWNFKVFSAPGHTCGSLMFLETTTNFLFSGDIIYTGKMYLHLKDSNFSSFALTIESICELVNKNDNVIIWPAHNIIPLPKEFPVQVKNAIEIYQSGGALPLAIWPKDSIFEEGHIYVIKDVELVIRSN